MNIKEEKIQLRRVIKAKFAEKQNIEIIKMSHFLQEEASYCENFLNRISSYKCAKTVFAYVSMDVEFPTMQLLKQIIRDEKILAVPRVDGKNLKFCQVHLENYEIVPLKKGAYNIMEPSMDAPILFPGEKEKLKELLPITVLVPGRAFSMKMARLGYGGGFYDRFFSTLFASCDRSLISLIGLCFSFQVLKDIPIGKYDVLVDEVFTEKI